jgi:prephenate dehydrogenase
VIVWPTISGRVAIAALSVAVTLKAPMPRITAAPMAAPAAFKRRPIVLTPGARRSCAEVLTIVCRWSKACDRTSIILVTATS